MLFCSDPGFVQGVSVSGTDGSVSPIVHDLLFLEGGIVFARVRISSSSGVQLPLSVFILMNVLSTLNESDLTRG